MTDGRQKRNALCFLVGVLASRAHMVRLTNGFAAILLLTSTAWAQDSDKTPATRQQSEKEITIRLDDLPWVTPDGHKIWGHDVSADPGYFLCREIKRDIKLSGASDLSRITVLARSPKLVYSIHSSPDTAFGIKSGASGTVTVLEVRDTTVSNCPKLKDAFPTYTEFGPSSGWAKATGYSESSAPMGNSPEEGGMLTVKAGEHNYNVYCTHKVIYESLQGTGEIGVLWWDDRSMTITYGVHQAHAGDAGSHIKLILLVRYLPKLSGDAERRTKYGCTAPPPPNYNATRPRLRQTQLADGSIFFEK
jgi:hypothetical protein